jgi:hypothetical protein
MELAPRRMVLEQHKFVSNSSAESLAMPAWFCSRPRHVKCVALTPVLIDHGGRWENLLPMAKLIGPSDLGTIWGQPASENRSHQ